jgi:small multidrug resistance pump
MLTRIPKAPEKWIKPCLQLAGIYNIVWGVWAVLFPNHFFQLAGMELPNYPMMWQCIGMIVGVYGIGYYLAAYDPYNQWPLILVGFLGKFLGPIGALFSFYTGMLPGAFLWLNLGNDFIWLIPFALILYKARKATKS